MDHWIPLTSPECPGTIPTNVVPLCDGIDGCNESKNDSNALEWLTRKYDQRKAQKIFEKIDAYFRSIKAAS